MVDIYDFRKGQGRKVVAMNRLAYQFTKKEVEDILKSWIVLSLAFTLANISRYFYGYYLGYYVLMQFLILLPIITIVAAIQFIGHEMAHKFTAQHYGLEAHFKSNNYMLLLGLMISLSGFLFFAPGAVVIQSYSPDRRTYGICAAAGPLTNIIVATALLPLYYIVEQLPIFIPLPGNLFIVMAYTLNAFVALYNLLPFGPFDGKKILDWNAGVFTVLIAIAAVLLVLVYVLQMYTL
jgi:Zn-dependent protease